MFPILGDDIYYLFYNGYEDTNKIYNEIIIPTIGMWNYPSDCINEQDLEDLGVVISYKESSSFMEIEQFVIGNLKQKNIIFFSVSSNVLPGLENVELDGLHSIMIEEYNENTNTFRLNDLFNVVNKWYEAPLILKIIQEMESTIIAIDFKDLRMTDSMKETFKQRAQIMIHNHMDEFIFYDKCIELIQSLENRDLAEIEKPIFAISQALSIVRGSRFNFANFLKSCGYTEVYDLLLHCSDLAEYIKNLLLKIEIQSKGNQVVGSFKQVVEKCAELKEFEKLALMLLKLEFSNSADGQSIESIRPKAQSPKIIKIRDKKPNGMTLYWDPPLIEEYIINYEVNINNKTYTTKEPWSKINNLQPNTIYRVRVKARNAFGDVSEPGTEIVVSTNTSEEQQDLALFKKVTASSTETESYEQNYLPNNVVDNDSSTRWSSEHSEPHWICVELGAEADINLVVLNWEAAFAKVYKVQLSSNGYDWFDIHYERAGRGGIERIHTNNRGSYIRVYCSERSTNYGFSLWGIHVFGIPVPVHV